jgi:acetoin utilization protein AcuA
LVNQGKAQLSLAVMDESIIGYAVILPPEETERWDQLPFVVMLGALEVAPAYRKNGVAKEILRCLFSTSRLKNKILMSLEYYWHWDLKNSRLDVYKYKRMLKHLLTSVGMEEYYTDEPDIRAHPANFMMGYVGREITLAELEQFLYLANPRVL